MLKTKEAEVKVIRNVPEEIRRREQEKLEEECDAIIQDTMKETEDFIEELDRYRVVSCPVCFEMTKVDMNALEEKVISEKQGFFRNVRTYAKPVECPECKSVLSLDEEKDFEWDENFLGAVKSLVALLVVCTILGLIIFGVSKSPELLTQFDAILSKTGVSPVELNAPQEPQEKVFSVTVTNIEQNAQGFQYELTDKEGMTIVVFSEIDQRYEVGKTIDVHAEYKTDGTKVFSENGNENSWEYTMNSKG